MNKGYTLLEAVIYVAVLGFLSIVLISTVILTSRTFIGFQVVNRLDESATLTLDRMVREIRQANSVDLGQSTFGSSPGRLVLNTTIGGTATTMQFYLQNGVVLVKQGSAAAATSTSPSVQATSLIFRYLTTSRSQAVRVELTLAKANGVGARTETFYTTAVLRGSY